MHQRRSSQKERQLSGQASASITYTQIKRAMSDRCEVGASFFHLISPLASQNSLRRKEDVPTARAEKKKDDRAMKRLVVSVD
jgi:hypothetical protein